MLKNLYKLYLAKKSEEVEKNKHYEYVNLYKLLKTEYDVNDPLIKEKKDYSLFIEAIRNNTTYPRDHNNILKQFDGNKEITKNADFKKFIQEFMVDFFIKNIKGDGKKLKDFPADFFENIKVGDYTLVNKEGKLRALKDGKLFPVIIKKDGIFIDKLYPYYMLPITIPLSILMTLPTLGCYHPSIYSPTDIFNKFLGDNF